MSIIFIISQMVMLAYFKLPDSDPYLYENRYIIHIGYNCLFTLEILCKLMAYIPKKYISNRQN